MSGKPKQHHKSKAELEAEAKYRAEAIREAKRMRSIIVEKCYPFLLKNTTDITDANIFLMTSKTTIGQAFSNQKRLQTIDELKILEKVDPKADRVELYKEFFEFFRYEKIIDAEEMIEGLGNEFDNLIRGEMKKRSISTLNMDLTLEKPQTNGELQK